MHRIKADSATAHNCFVTLFNNTWYVMTSLDGVFVIDTTLEVPVISVTRSIGGPTVMSHAAADTFCAMGRLARCWAPAIERLVVARAFKIRLKDFGVEPFAKIVYLAILVIAANSSLSLVLKYPPSR